MGIRVTERDGRVEIAERLVVFPQGLIRGASYGIHIAGGRTAGIFDSKRRGRHRGLIILLNQLTAGEAAVKLAPGTVILC